MQVSVTISGFTRLFDNDIAKVIDAAKVIDNATYDKPHQYPSGIEYVIVNGTPVLDAGKHMGTRPGAILHGRGKVQ